MDPVTSDAIAELSKRYPNKAIKMSHQFLDGVVGRPCGMVPNEWGGGMVSVTGPWWHGKDYCSIKISN